MGDQGTSMNVMNVSGLEYSMMDGKTQCMSKKHIANLASEISAFEKFTDLVITSWVPILDNLIDMTRKIITDAFNSAEVHIYGSYFTGLWLLSSDVDIVVKGLVDSCKTHERSSREGEFVRNVPPDWTANLVSIG